MRIILLLCISPFVFVILNERSPGQKTDSPPGTSAGNKTGNVVRKMDFKAFKDGDWMGQQIAKEVDFTKEYVLFFAWLGGSDGKLTFSVAEGPLVIFGFEGGYRKDLATHLVVFVVSKNADYRTAKYKRVAKPIK